MWSESIDVLAPLGRLVYYGNASSGDQPMPIAEEMRVVNRALMGFNIVGLARQDPERFGVLFDHALDLVARGKVRLDITEVLPLEEAAEAHRRIDDRSTTGKLVLQVRG